MPVPLSPSSSTGNIDVGDQRGLRADLAHLRAGGDEENVVGEFFHFAAVSLLALAEAEIDDGVEFGFLKRLGQVILRAQLHGVHDFARVVDAGKHHDFDAGLDLAQLLERLQAVDAGHEHVEQHQIGPQTFFDELRELLRRWSRSRLCSRRLRAAS